MSNGDIDWITNFIWGIADDVLRDVYVRGRYRDIILPMVVLRRLDAVLEPTKKPVIEMRARLDDAGITNQDAALRQAAGQAFYNTSNFTLRDLRARASQQQLKADFEAYLDGFSPNVQEILACFEFRNQIPRLSRADALGTLIERFLDPSINLSPNPVKDSDGSIRLPGLDNHAMGTIFEELVRRFNEENNEEAGEHWTPRDAVKLMARLVLLPIADQIESGTYLLYDGACGTGGMLTVAEETLRELAGKHGKEVATHLFGQEVNAETYAIAKADFLLKGEGEAADNLVGGPEYSTLANDAFPSNEFDFMLSNPPYGKSWKSDLERMGGKASIRNPRFLIEHADEPEYSLLTRSSDGQMMFLVNMLSKMKRATKLGSRIAEVHNGSSLFTGDAGQGESNIRRWIIENDWLEAIIALPSNMFYNTGIATYVWVVTNRKPAHRRGKVQLIDATGWSVPLRRNLGKKNCELSNEDIARICDQFLAFEPTETSKIFENAEFGYWRVTVERPLRLVSQLTPKAIDALQFASGDEEIRVQLYDEFGDALWTDFRRIKPALEQRISQWGADEVGVADAEEPAPRRNNLPERKRSKLLDSQTWERDAGLVETATELRHALGSELFADYNVFREQVDAILRKLGRKLTATDRRTILRAVSWREEDAPPVIAKVHNPDTTNADPLHGLHQVHRNGRTVIVEYESDPELRDTEQVRLTEPGGIDAFIIREVLPYAPDAWVDKSKTKIGYEISFSRHFYRPQPLRSLDVIRAEIFATQKETEDLLPAILGGVS
jgi:type I restriction enzyme M protein